MSASSPGGGRPSSTVASTHAVQRSGRGRRAPCGRGAGARAAPRRGRPRSVPSRPSAVEQGAGVGEGAARRRVEPREVVGVAAPRRQLEGEAGEVDAAISGSANGRRAACSTCDHRRQATPGPSRPARPARWSADAFEAARSAAGSCRCGCRAAGSRARPASTTTWTPSTVSDVSAMSVARIDTRGRTPATRARSCSAAGSDRAAAGPRRRAPPGVATRG